MITYMDFELKKIMSPLSFAIDRSLISTMKTPCFTKMAVSPLILVRFSKFEIWHAQHFGPDLEDVRDVMRDVMRAR